MTHPLPCPHCLSPNISVDQDIESCVCHACGATGPSLLRKAIFDTDEEMFEAAIKAWNRRPALPSFGCPGHLLPSGNLEPGGHHSCSREEMSTRVDYLFDRVMLWARDLRVASVWVQIRRDGFLEAPWLTYSDSIGESAFHLSRLMTLANSASW